jgi:hypothetical protein
MGEPHRPSDVHYQGLNHEITSNETGYRTVFLGPLESEPVVHAPDYGLDGHFSIRAYDPGRCAHSGRIAQ